MLTSKKSHSDTTTILMPEDHDFIKHETVVNYATAKIFEVSNIESRIAARDFEPTESFAPEVISRIKEGLRQSTRTENDIKRLFLSLPKS